MLRIFQHFYQAFSAVDKKFDFNSLHHLTNTNENNLVAFYLVFVEIKSRFQFYGKSERKHVKYFLKCTIYKNCAEKLLIEQNLFFKFLDQSFEPFGSDHFGNSIKF